MFSRVSIFVSLIIIKKEKKSVLYSQYSSYINAKLTSLIQDKQQFNNNDVTSNFVNRTVHFSFLTFHSRFHRLGIMHSDIMNIL